MVRTIAGRGAWAAEVPEKSTPPPPPGPAAFARESPPVPRSGGAGSVHPVRARKREAGPPTGEIMGDRPPESALLGSVGGLGGERSGSASGEGRGFGGGENDCGRVCVWAGSRRKAPHRHPPTGCVCPGISSGPAERGGQDRSTRCGPKKGSGFPTWGNYGGQTARISPAEGWGGSWSGEAGAWGRPSGRLRGTDRLDPLGEHYGGGLEGSGGRGIRLRGEARLSRW